MIRDFARALVIVMTLLVLYAEISEHDEAVLNKQISTTKETQ